MERKIEEVIILGAGASKSDGVPLQKDLIKEFLTYYGKLKNAEAWSLTGDQEESLINFFWDVTIRYYNKNF